MLAFLIFIFIILAFAHFYLESFVIPIILLKYKQDIECLLERFDRQVKRNPHEFPDLLKDVFFLNLQKSSQYLGEYSLMAQSLRSRFRNQEEKNRMRTNSHELGLLIKQNRHKDFLNEIMLEHNKIMRIVHATNSYGAILGFFPLVIYALILFKVRKFPYKNTVFGKEFEFLKNLNEYFDFPEYSSEKRLAYT